MSLLVVLDALRMSNDYPKIGHIWDIAELLRGATIQADVEK
jgi:hypothetical protein